MTNIKLPGHNKIKILEKNVSREKWRRKAFELKFVSAFRFWCQNSFSPLPFRAGHLNFCDTLRHNCANASPVHRPLATPALANAAFGIFGINPSCRQQLLMPHLVTCSVCRAPFSPSADHPRGCLEQVWKSKLFFLLHGPLPSLPFFFLLSWCSAPSCCFYSCCSNFNEDNQCLLCLFSKQIRT